MRSTTLLSAAACLLASASTASAAGTLGFALGDKNADGSCKTSSDYTADFKAISDASGSKIVRGYSASDCNTTTAILPAAKSAGFKVILGIWPDYDVSYAADKAAILAAAPQYASTIYAITVGSETMYRGNFTGEQLLAKIQDIRSSLSSIAGTSSIKVGTADSWNKFQDGTADALMKTGGADILLCNAFSYWQGQDISNATGSFFDDIMQAFGRVQAVSGGTDKIELWVGETGWTTSGTKYQNAVPSVDNAKTFFQQGVCGILAWGFNAFFFEAFDEPWKPVSVGQDGSSADETHWGAMNADRTTKYALKC